MRKFQVLIKNENNNEIDKKVIKSQKPSLSGKADNILLTTNFTLKNFKKVFYEDDFVDLLLTTFYFTFLVQLEQYSLEFLLLSL